GTLAFIALFDHNFWKHFQFVIGISLCFGVADIILWKLHTDVECKRTFCESFYIGDLPALVAFGILFMYGTLHPDTESPHVFLAGAISFQLLASNVLFVMSQAGLIRNIWESPTDSGEVQRESAKGGA